MCKKFNTLGYTSKDAGLRGNYRGIIAEIARLKKFKSRSHALRGNAYGSLLSCLSVFLTKEVGVCISTCNVGTSEDLAVRLNDE